MKTIDYLFEKMISSDYPEPEYYFLEFSENYKQSKLKSKLRIIEAMTYLMKMIEEEAKRLIEKESIDLLYSGNRLKET